MSTSQLLKPLLRHSDHARADVASGTCGQAQEGVVLPTYFFREMGATLHTLL